MSPEEEPQNEYSAVMLLLLVVFVLWLLYRWQASSRLHQMGDKLPGSMSLPLIGSAYFALWLNPEDLVNFGFVMRRMYGDVARAWIGTNLYVFIDDAYDVEVILNSSLHIDKAPEYRFFEPWLGEGLLISSGEKWRSHRKIIAPTFHINILKTFIPVFNKISKKLVDKMRAEMNRTFDVHDYMGGATVDILLETVMGISKGDHEETGTNYTMAVMKMCAIIHQRQYKIWYNFDALFKLTPFCKMQSKLLNTIHGFTNEVIKMKKQMRLDNKTRSNGSAATEQTPLKHCSGNSGAFTNDSTRTTSTDESLFKGYRDDLDFIDENDVGERKRLAFLDLMLELSDSGEDKLSENEIKEEVDTIMFEGHDTTAAGSSFVLCLLGVHQDVQNKVYQELYEIFGDSDRPVTFSDTLRMKYLERVIFATLRMYPPVPLFGRLLKHDVNLVFTNNYVLPAGATVVICTIGVHRNSKYIKDPDVLNPDNFLPENIQNRPYYSHIPFSAGPRGCVGRKYAILKLKVLLANVLRNFKVTSKIPEDQFKLTIDIILKRLDGFKIQIESRRKANTH